LDSDIVRLKSKGKSKKFKFNPKHSLLILTISVILVGGVYMGSNEVNGVLFTVTDTVGDRSVADVDCWGKSTDSIGGEEIAKSSFLAGHPTFDFVTVTSETDTSETTIQHDLKQRCTFPTGNSETTSLPIVVKAGSEFKVSVYAYEKGVDAKQLVFTQTKKVQSDVELFWNTEATFLTFDVPLENIVDGLKIGKYQAQVEIQTEGTAKMYYKDIVASDDSLWKYPFENNDIRTFFDFPIDKKTGKVGGIQDGTVFDKPPIKDTSSKSNDDITEFIECAKIMNTECLFNEKFNTIWTGLIILGAGVFIVERNRE
jgi:hypothetical protein